MIGGSVHGDILSGSHVFDAVVVEAPADVVSLADFAPTVSGGASVFAPLDSVTIVDFDPTIFLLLVVDLPLDSVTLEDFDPSVSGGASVFAPLDSVTIEDFVFEVQVLIKEIPDFYAFRDGSTVDITFRNREGKEIELFKSPQQNKSMAQLAFVTSDTYQDTGVTGNPKYQARFVSRISGEFNAKGQKSTKKLTVEK